MMSLFKRKTKKEKLQSKYEKLMKESFELSKVNRGQSDAKIAEAELVLKEIATLW